MTDILWSPRAIADIESIREYIANDSSRYADLVVRRLVAAIDRLSQFPRSGRIVPELGRPETRELVVRPYRVVHRVGASAVEIVTIFHAARLLAGLPE